MQLNGKHLWTILYVSAKKKLSSSQLNFVSVHKNL